MLIHFHNNPVEAVDPLINLCNHTDQFIPYAVDAFVGLVDAPALVNQVYNNSVCLTILISEDPVR